MANDNDRATFIYSPNGSLFVVFRDTIAASQQGSGGENFPQYSDAAELSGPWEVKFDPAWGGPASVNFPQLESWTSRSEFGVKYYSGTGTYRKSFDVPLALQGTGTRISINLGEVKYAAEVRLNGIDLGPVWTKPFRVEITNAVKPEGNVLEIDVANVWPNRIIGDSLLPPDQRLTRTNIVYTQNTPLWQSGLLGPVKIERIEGGPR